MPRHNRDRGLRTKTSNNKNRRRGRNNAPSRYSDSTVTTICYGSDEEERGRRSRSGSPKDHERRARGRRGTDEEIKEAFHAKTVEYNIDRNTKAHHTDKFACTEKALPTLVVRRGQPFLLTITFDREYEKVTHDLMFDFSTGDNPKPPKGTAVEIDMEENANRTHENHKEWYAKMVENDKKNCQIKVEITPPSNCIIGKWDFSIETSFRNKPSDKALIFKYDCKREIIILLNPWCPHDTVYFQRQDELREYILLEHGCVYTGNFKQIDHKRWDHGQFQCNNLEIILALILEYFSNTVDRRMGDPVQLSRAISSAVNSASGGVLVGNWSGKYEGGIPPTKWQSSTTILQEYNKNCSPVKYGQCWVFSALTTTFSRAIGLPCRSVTNFCSAHDTDGSCKVDKEFRLENGEKCAIKNGGDSIWNFHVWNEAWMTRPDIGKGADGWQAFDATPQELSDGDYRCGPASVHGIRRGEIRYPHDAPFIFSEVNADVYHWLQLSRDQWRLMKVEKHKVGRCISTKYPDGKRFKDQYVFFGGTERLDITDNYKFKEGSPEERLAVKCAGKHSDGDIHEDEDVIDDDIQMEIDVQDGALFGSSFEIKVCAKNISTSWKELNLEQVSLELAECSYDGDVGDAFCKKKLNGTLTIPKLKEKDFSFKICCEDYENDLRNPYSMAITVKAKVKETKESIAETETNCRLRRPIVKIEAPDTVPFGKSFDVKLTVNTPFKRKLTNCCFSVIGTRIRDIESTQIDSKYLGDDGSWEQTVTLKPLRKGEASIAVDFDSKQIQDVMGSANLDVE